MAKQSGLGDRLYVAGRNLSGDIGAVNRISDSHTPLDVTGIDKSAFERLSGMRDGAIDFTAFFNDAAGQAHPILAALPTTDKVVSYLRGTIAGNPAASMVAKQINYDPTRGQDGSLTFKTQALANAYGLDWGRQLTPGSSTLGGAGSTSGVDFTASTAFGLQAYLHVLAFTGTDATVKLQESSDNAGTDPYADVVGGAFAQITSGTPTGERIATSASLTVERWLRVSVVTSGGFSNLQFAVIVTKNEAAVRV